MNGQNAFALAVSVVLVIGVFFWEERRLGFTVNDVLLGQIVALQEQNAGLHAPARSCDQPAANKSSQQDAAQTPTAQGARGRGSEAGNKTVQADNAGWCRREATTVPLDLLVPIFLITRDRLRMTNMTVNAIWDTVSSPFEIILLDQNSTYPPMLSYMQSLESEGRAKVIRAPEFPAAPTRRRKGVGKLAHTTAWVRQTVIDYLAARPSIRFYVVSDPDISIRTAASDILLFQAGVLEACPAVFQVGVALRISNIPDSYPKKKQAVDWEKSFFWGELFGPFTGVEWGGTAVSVYPSKIDTTWAMRRASTQWWPLHQPAFRTGSPYMGEHLGWYFGNTSDDENYYNQRAIAAGISQWAVRN